MTFWIRRPQLQPERFETQLGTDIAAQDWTPRWRRRFSQCVRNRPAARRTTM
jgi:hypothetical protein